MVNFLGLMGYNVGENEIVTIDQFIDTFDITKVSLGGPVFDLVKLGWVNNQHMRKKDIAELVELAKPFFVAKGYITETPSEKEMKALTKVVEILREGANTLKEIAELADIYYVDSFVLDTVTEEMNKNERKSVERLYHAIEDETGKKSIKLFMEKLENANEDLTEEEVKALLQSTLEEIGEGPGKVLMPLRVVITGRGKGSELYNVVSIIGKTRTLNRINEMVKKYNIF